MKNNMSFYCLKLSQPRIGVRYLRIGRENYPEKIKGKPFDFYSCKKIEKWNNNNYIIYQEDGIRIDITRNRIAFYVSDKFKNLIEKFSTPDLVEFYNIPFFDEKKENKITSYYVMNILVNIKNRNKVKSQIYYEKPFSIVVSEDLKNELEKNNLKRFSFYKYRDYSIS